MLSNLQLQIAELILKGNPDGSLLDIDQLNEILPGKRTKNSLQCTLRLMVDMGYIEKVGKRITFRNGVRRQRMCLACTPLCNGIF